MQYRRPIAFVDQSGFVIPAPNFNAESARHINGRFIYTTAELEMAIEEQERLQTERRALADDLYGAEAKNAQIGPHDVIGDVIENMEGVRETVPSFTADPKRTRKTQGPSNKLHRPNRAHLPPTLEGLPKTVDVDAEGNPVGIDTNAAVAAMFGSKE